MRLILSGRVTNNLTRFDVTEATPGTRFGASAYSARRPSPTLDREFESRLGLDLLASSTRHFLKFVFGAFLQALRSPSLLHRKII